MALAVPIDASIVRVLLVPAMMRLFGRSKWWAPGSLGRIAERVGFSHAEADDLQRTAGTTDGRAPGPGIPGVAGPDGSLADGDDAAIGSRLR